MQTDVRRRINESSTVFFTAQDIKDALNDGLEEISDATEWYERQATIDWTVGEIYTDLSTVLPDTILSILRCWNTTTQRWLDPTDPWEMDYHSYRQWELTTGQPQKYFIRGLWHLGIWPAPDSAQKIRVVYTAIPPAMSADADDPDFPKEFHFGLIDYALSDLYSQERETTKAFDRWTRYLTTEERLRQDVNHRQSLARLNIL